MTKEKTIYTITKTGYIGGDFTDVYENAFEKLYDALQHIAIWSNMKTIRGYTVKLCVKENASLTEEHRYLAEKVDENRWVSESEELILRKITLKLEKEP